MSSRRSFMKACALGFAGLSGAFALANFAGEKSLGRSGDLSGNLGDLAEFGENLVQNLAKFSRVFIKDAWIKDTPHFEADLALEIDGDISQIYTPLRKAFAANAVIIGLGSEASFFVLSQMGRDFGFRVAEYGLVAAGGFAFTQNQAQIRGLDLAKNANSTLSNVGFFAPQSSAQNDKISANLSQIHANLGEIQGLNSVKNTNLNSKLVDCFGSLCEPRNDGVGVNLIQNSARIQGLNLAQNANLSQIHAKNANSTLSNVGFFAPQSSAQNDKISANLSGIHAKNTNLNEIYDLNSVKNANLNSKLVDCFGSLCEPRNDGVGGNLSQISAKNDKMSANLSQIHAKNTNLGEIQALNSPQNNDNTTIITSNSARFFILAPKGVKL